MDENAGTDVDVKRVKSTFEHSDIIFVVVPILNLTSARLTALIAAISKSLTRDASVRHFDCLICACVLPRVLIMW